MKPFPRSFLSELFNKHSFFSTKTKIPSYYYRIVSNLLFFLLLLQVTGSIAQPADARVTFTPATNGFITATFNVQLPDSFGFSEVDVRLIDSIEDSTLYSRSFLFDQTTGLPSGITWQRQGTDVQLGIGTIPERIAWLGKVRLKTTAGQWSDWYEFLF